MIHLAMPIIEILLLTNVVAYKCILSVVNLRFAARLKYNTPNERLPTATNQTVFNHLNSVLVHLLIYQPISCTHQFIDQLYQPIKKNTFFSTDTTQDGNG